jgi:hypothetical protein
LVYPEDTGESQDNTEWNLDASEPAAEGDIEMEFSSVDYNKYINKYT